VCVSERERESVWINVRIIAFSFVLSILLFLFSFLILFCHCIMTGMIFYGAFISVPLLIVLVVITEDVSVLSALLTERPSIAHVVGDMCKKTLVFVWMCDCDMCAIWPG
jgi:hypothetical protein